MIQHRIRSFRQSHQLRPQWIRWLSSASPAADSSPVSLSYSLYPPLKPTAEPASPIIVMHGLFGSKQNNRSISKVFAKNLNRPVYAVDLRNHGDSPHHTKHDYPTMAKDVAHFIKEHELGPSTLLGHSMGAKTAMALALMHPELVTNIVAVDNSPVEVLLGSSFAKYLSAMSKIENSHFTKKQQADEILREEEPNEGIRQFLLTNLVRNEEGKLKWRIPLAILKRNLDMMAGFPFHPDKVRFEKPALFVRGTKSTYVPDETIPVIGRFFPYFRLVDVEAGHWVISENPEAFREAVESFLNPQD